MSLCKLRHPLRMMESVTAKAAAVTSFHCQPKIVELDDIYMSDADDEHNEGRPCYG